MYTNEAKNKAILFAYSLHPRAFNQYRAVRLQGLDPNKKYKLEEINKMSGSRSGFTSEGKTFSGDYLIKIGLKLPNNGDSSSAVIEITEVK
jgi:alpha-galactosidase